ncbi:Asp-tRNA(Asn)/Glu-tRNA(Gln) amidotransferase A subunit family amidase [Rahnella sp. BIGb0236]|nr:amidase [Rahnella victoriana]PBI78830.1 hypothetical protein A9993_03420 [Rahnella victoriana]TDS90204.1 Asp-tRNA(Asn)/Glu-tRNA(Gln) amidotransferase A subunit family amidase [Rahnella sp. BIGb0236]
MMSTVKRSVITIGLLLANFTSYSSSAEEMIRQNSGFTLNEATISSIRQAVLDNKVSCEAIVSSYLSRISSFDHAGMLPINAIIATNPKALDRAREIDRSPTEKNLPLACTPLIVKDNIDVKGMPTTAGSKSMRNNLPADNATQVTRLEKAGAIVLAKSNLAEFAWTPDYSNSSLGGLTRNPYDPLRTTGGSSGGTAAAVAANFGVAGLGTDTGASIRGPSALQNLVGLRPTLGASSRDGVIPIWLTRDTLGPIARSVSDAALLYQATYGYDPKDASTQAARTAPSFDSAAVLRRGALNGMRVGVMRQVIDAKNADPEVMQRFQQAEDDLRTLGAVVVEVNLPDFKKLTDIPWPNRMEYDLNTYLQAEGADRSVKSFAEVVKSGQYLGELSQFLKAQVGVPNPEDNPAERNDEKNTSALRAAIVGAMNRENLSVLIYPTWTQPPRLLTKMTGDGGNDNPVIAQAGLPAITVPMGNTRGNLPTGLQIAGRPFSEAVLFSAAYDYEQSTHHRTAPLNLPAAAIAK